MRLEYDPQSRDFIKLGGQGLDAVKRFSLSRTAFSSMPTVEDAFQALAILRSIRVKPPANAPARPSPAPKAKTEQQLLDDFIAKGGHVVQSTYDPVPKSKKAGTASVLKEPKAKPKLEDLLGSLSKEEIQALLLKLSA